MLRQLILVLSLLFSCIMVRGNAPDKFVVPDSTAFLLIDKANLSLYFVDDNGNIENQYGIACAVNYGDKREVGDFKTPEGVFHINEVVFSKYFYHDFEDGNGPILHAYGPWFLRLDSAFPGIGIHGTHLPESIGSRCTEGCIRMANEDISDLKQKVTIGMPVLVLPDSCGIKSISEIGYKLFDYSFVAPTKSSVVDSLSQIALNAGNKICRISTDISEIVNSITLIHSSRNVVFENLQEDSLKVVNRVLQTYAQQDSTVKSLFYPSDSLINFACDNLPDGSQDSGVLNYKYLIIVVFFLLLCGTFLFLKHVKNGNG